MKVDVKGFVNQRMQVFEKVKNNLKVCAWHMLARIKIFMDYIILQ